MMHQLAFADRLRGLHLKLAPASVDKLRRYRDLIAAAAERFNLTAVRDPGAIERRHLLESLALSRLLADHDLLASGARVIDLGSGAGLPGIPIRLAWPELRLSLLESNAKRCAFLRLCLEDLDLPDVEVLEGRAEDFGHAPEHRAAYDLVLARALAPLPVLAEYALPFLRLGGHLAALKGSGAGREVEEAAGALAELGGAVVETLALEPPEGVPQSVVIIRKQAPTPDRYARRAGIPAKRPLT